MAGPLTQQRFEAETFVPAPAAPSATRAHDAYRALYVAFVLAPIIAGVDKFLHLLVNWDQYLAPAITRSLSVSGHTFMLAVGAGEVGAGLLVAAKPSVGGWIIAAWLWATTVNLLLIPAYYDVALRDFGLSLGAIALARLARDFEHA